MFLRAQTFNEAINVFSNINLSNKSNIYSMGLNNSELHFTFWLLLCYMLIEYINEKKGNLINIITNRNIIIRFTFYLLLILSVIFLGAYGVGFNDTNFIYFQF